VLTSAYIALDVLLLHGKPDMLIHMGALAFVWAGILVLTRFVVCDVVSARALETALCVVTGASVSSAVAYGSTSLAGDVSNSRVQVQIILILFVTTIPLLPRIYLLTVSQFVSAMLFTWLVDVPTGLSVRPTVSHERLAAAMSLIEVMAIALLTLFFCLSQSKTKRRSYAYYRAVQELAHTARELALKVNDRALLAAQLEREQVQLEAGKQARSRLLRTVMHDLRSPLLSVLNSTAMLNEIDPATRVDDDDVVGGLQVITSCVSLLEQIVSDMLGAHRARARGGLARTGALRAPHRSARGRERFPWTRLAPAWLAPTPLAPRAASLGRPCARDPCRACPRPRALALRPRPPPLRRPRGFPLRPLARRQTLNAATLGGCCSYRRPSSRRSSSPTCCSPTAASPRPRGSSSRRRSTRGSRRSGSSATRAGCSSA
jgi:signal transduction histidine kinase